MTRLNGQVAIVTGAGRGLGREYALALAAEGASVVVNDLGVAPDGTTPDTSAADAVVAEITDAGGRAVANADDVADWDGAQRLVSTAVEAFGDLHVLVNNAGILRDGPLAKMTEEDFDSVVAVHLKGHFAPTRWAFRHWAKQGKAGRQVQASVVNTTSIAGLAGFGTVNYSSAKAGIAQFTVVAATEGSYLGVRVNAVAPAARTRLTIASFGEETMAPKPDQAFDSNDPANVAPLVVYLALPDCPVTGAVLHVGGNQIGLFRQWDLACGMEADGRWDVGALEQAVPTLLEERVSMPSVRISFESYIRTIREGFAR